MARKRGCYRKVPDFDFQGHQIVGLKRRPDGRFYSATKPTKTFGTDPAEAVSQFWQWQQGLVKPGSFERVTGFLFWRNLFRNMILHNPQLAGEVLGVDQLKQMVSLREALPLMSEPDFNWMRIMLPDPDPLDED